MNLPENLSKEVKISICDELIKKLTDRYKVLEEVYEQFKPNSTHKVALWVDREVDFCINHIKIIKKVSNVVCGVR